MAKKLTHYKDTQTGRYVTKQKWTRARKRGSERYKRTYERYVKPTGPRKHREITPPPIPSRIVERLKYQSRKRQLDIEVVSDNGKITSVRIGRRTYRQRASIILLTPLIEGARISPGHAKRKRRSK